MGNSRLLKMSAKLFEPVDVASLAFFRVTFGLIMVWNVYHYWLDAEDSFLLPIFHFKYYGFSWVKALPGDWIYYLLALLGFLALLITVGLFYRIAAALFFIGLIYVFLLTKELYLNHMYLVCLLSFLLIFIPCYRSFSLDALINPKIRSQVIPAWCLWLVRGQIGIVYFYAGLAKLNPDWLHGEPVRLWLAPLASYPVLGQFFTKEWFVYLVSYGGLGFDLLIVPLLLFRKTRVIGYLWAIMFHLLNVYIFEIGIFPWLMIAATLIFFSPSWPRQVLASIQRKKLDMEEAAPMPKLSPFYRYSATLFVTVYLALQLLIPFRHFLYPGNASWTEEGHRFSWRMKLRDKRSHVIYYVTDPKSQRTWELPPESILRLLTPWQYLKMSIRPDMILEFSHYLAEHFKQNGFPDVEVRARILNSLNGRPHQLLIDPDVDLAKVRARLWSPASWILPLNELK
jgi:hypothetical protein